MRDIMMFLGGMVTVFIIIRIEDFIRSAQERKSTMESMNNFMKQIEVSSEKLSKSETKKKGSK